MHDTWLMIAACAGLASLLPVLLRLRAGLRGTALAHAWSAAFLAWTVWIIVAIVTMRPFHLRAWADCLWYVAAVVGLIPPIAALGARRPINRAWTGFVLLPLVLVFIWPVMPTVWRGAVGSAAFDLETPLALGFVLVSVMGAGNYLGLAHTGPALLWMAGLWLVVLPMCPFTSEWMPRTWLARASGTLCLVAAAWIADRQVARRRRTPDNGRPPLDRVWRDFRELFGIVWARRIMERFNDDARRQRWQLCLGLRGFENDSGGAVAADFDRGTLAAAEASLRWLLQKFVDPDWIDRRIQRKTSSQPEA